MLLTSLSSRSFRNLEPDTLEFHPRANVFVGNNGQGKTAYLEAIYLLATTRSFRTHRTANLIRFGEDHLFVSGSVERDGLTRQLSIGIDAPPSRRREIQLNGQKTEVSTYVDQLQVFAYSSARLEILRGGPEEKRRFLDRGVASVQPGTIAKLNRYSKVLRQRNALLTRIADGEAKPASLDAWDVELAREGLELVRSRSRYADLLEERFRALVEEHQYHVRELTFDYLTTDGFDPSSSLEDTVEHLRAERRRELRAGFTLFGPHRDNLSLEIEGRDAAEVLSSGETKMIVLFLKLAKIALFRSRFEDSPVFVFDDIDAELDLPVIERLLPFLTASAQLFTSSAKQRVLKDLSMGEHRSFALDRGSVVETADSAA